MANDSDDPAMGASAVEPSPPAATAPALGPSEWGAARFAAAAWSISPAEWTWALAGTFVAALFFSLSLGGVFAIDYYEPWDFHASDFYKASVIMHGLGGVYAFAVCLLALSGAARRNLLAQPWGLLVALSAISIIGLSVEGRVSMLSVGALIALIAISGHYSAALAPQRVAAATRVDERSTLQRIVDRGFALTAAVNIGWLAVMIVFAASFGGVGETVIVILAATVLLATAAGGTLGGLIAERWGIERGARLGAMILLSLWLLLGTAALVYFAVAADAATGVLDDLV